MALLFLRTVSAAVRKVSRPNRGAARKGVICEDAWETPLSCVTYEIFGAPGGQQTKQLAARMPRSETGEKHIPIATYLAALDFLRKFIQKKMLNRCVEWQAKRSGPVRGQMS